jgi:hypothetical protein
MTTQSSAQPALVGDGGGGARTPHRLDLGGRARGRRIPAARGEDDDLEGPSHRAEEHCHARTLDDI